jgi:carboxyl-terminal processing protease
MRTMLRSWHRGWIAGVVALALGASFFAGSLSAQDDLRTQLDVFGQVLSYVQGQYVDPVDNQKLIKGAIDGMLATLDPHSVYMPADRYEQFSEGFKPDYSGIGINFDIRDGNLIVISPLEGTPAFKLGIRAADRIVAIDGEDVSRTITNNDVFKKLRGPEGSMVKVTIERDNVVGRMDFDIKRARIPQESVPYGFMIRPGVGYIRITRFAQKTGEELETKLEQLKAQGMKELLLDLRFNSGGLLNQAVEVSDRFLPETMNGKPTKIVYTRGRGPSAASDYYATARDKFVDFPMVVLVDHGSASASGITAGAIQDTDRGVVAGVTTFGKGLVQNQVRLRNDSALLLTIAKYYTPSGRLIQRDYGSGDRQSYQEEAYSRDVEPDSVLASRPKFQTEGGRTVYGGGGIRPDVIVPSESLSTAEVDLERASLFFDYATRIVGEDRAKFPKEFDEFARGWDVSPVQLAEFKKFALDKKVKLTGVQIDSEERYIRRRLKAEVASNLYGLVARYRIDAEGDGQLQKALDLFPQARKLLATSTDGGKRKI